ncbi:MAG: hypothetical protein A3J28_12020 [Acidobacteria bacterium RIFCSPLOWO2_12_FULL_60_22]|nr:MAG: hypothetical protein A3J28_12020 [Acidobacteria bacterium RIFCSPLOWO2_12_FULL_60_22]
MNNPGETVPFQFGNIQTDPLPPKNSDPLQGIRRLKDWENCGAPLLLRQGPEHDSGNGLDHTGNRDIARYWKSLDENAMDHRYGCSPYGCFPWRATSGTGLDFFMRIPGWSSRAKNGWPAYASRRKQLRPQRVPCHDKTVFEATTRLFILWKENISFHVTV